MPIRITDSNNVLNYLIPAPFISINKTFDKQGDGEIIGSNYSITLTGTLLADRGSPTSTGGFIANGVDALEDLDSDGDVNDEPEHKWYKSLQNKQKALMNLFSKGQEGAYLEVLNPDTPETAGFSAFVKFDSIDLPVQAPGNPFKTDYTINLTANYIIGPAGSQTNDKDDWENEISGWLISAASENYDIVEADQYVYDRKGIFGRTGGTLHGELLNHRKLYTLTRTISATGKSKFERETTKPEGLESGDQFTTIYAKNGRAWQQARGFVYDKIKYGHNFLFGRNDTEFTTSGASASPPTGSSKAADLSADPDDIHLFGLNLPVPDNTTDTKDEYKAFNYVRKQTVDVRSGSFNVTETWLLAPKESTAIESVDFSITEDMNTGLVNVSINGNIAGLLDNADDVGVGQITNEDRNANRPSDVDQNFNYGGTTSADNSKYQNALDYYHTVMPFFPNTAQALLNDINEYKNLTIFPLPTSKSVAQQIATGTITYSLSFEARQRHVVPYTRSENYNISDTYPGRVVAQHVVLGRRLGPVLQDIGTQTQWQRSFSISVTVDVHRENICVDSKDQITTIGDSTTCAASNDFYGAAHAWIPNPNYVNARDSLDTAIAGGVYHTNNMATAKPSYSLGSVNHKKQWTAIRDLIASFNPGSYWESSGFTPKSVRKWYANAPSESWNPKTGEWSYNISWVYEINDPWIFPTTDYLNGANNDLIEGPYPGQEF